MQENLKLRNDRCTFDERKPRGFFEWIDDYQKNKPQSNAIAAGIMLMICSGHHIGWGIFNNHIQSQPWAGGYEDEGTVFWAIISWFIAGIAGFVISVIVVGRFSKISIYVFGSVLSAASSGILLARPESIYFIFPARILAGLTHGIVYPTVLIHASEVAIPRMRGMVVSLVHFCIIIGVFSASSSMMPVFATQKHEIDPTRSIGMNGLICTITGILIAIFFNRESPVFLIKKYRDEEALNIMIRLRSEPHETVDITREFTEFKAMVVEDGRSNLNILDRKNRWPLFVVVIMKIIFVASFNMPLNLVLLEATETDLYNGVNDISGMCLSGTRWIVIMVMIFVIDLKRIKFYMTSAGLSGVILLLLVYVIETSGGGFDESSDILVLAFIFQAFSGIAVGILADVYTTEAFNTKKKPMSIAFASIVEFLLQIFMVSSFFYFEIQLTLLLGSAGVVMLIGLLFFVVPDTSKMSLRNARNKFISSKYSDCD